MLLNEDLIGVPGGAAQLETPALVLDMPAFRRNVARMMERVAGTGIALRPHAKTHKCAHVAEIQLAAGAQGICVAKLREAEILGQEGIGDILVTSPVVGDRAIRRLMALNARMERLAVVADEADSIATLNAAMEAAGQQLTVLLDLDVGTHRTGALFADAPGLARLIMEAPNLRFGGLQAYGGILQHLHSHALRAERTRGLWEDVRDLVDLLRAQGIPCPVVTGGGTGTHEADIASGVLTELQTGSYIFMDREYGEIEAGSEDAPFEQALFVYTRVISRRQKVFVTTDAGIKAVATDGPLPSIAGGAPDGARYILQGDEHGGVVLGGTGEGGGRSRSDEDLMALSDMISSLNADDSAPAPARDIPLGHLIICAAPHCDPTVNLYDHIHCVEDGMVTAIWPVHARGCSQ